MGGGGELILRLDGNLAYWVTTQATNQFQDFGANQKGTWVYEIQQFESRPEFSLTGLMYKL